MDKRDIKDYIKIVLMIYGGMFGLIALPIQIIFSIISGIINGNIVESLIIGITSLLRGILLISISIFLILGLIYIFQLLKRKSDIISSKEYVRDLPEYFSPAIVSLLLDNSIEVATDYTASIAYLLSKKYIEIDGVTEEVKIIKDEYEKLQIIEEYSLNCIMKRIQFIPEEFKKIVISEAESLGFIEKGRRKIHFLRNFSIALATMFILSVMLDKVTNPILYNLLGVLGILSELAIFAVIGYSIYLANKYITEDYHRTDLGKKEAKKWSGVKKYIKEYTLLSNKNLDDTILFDDYIPYAIALGEAKEIEKYIEKNNKYRILIYGKINSFYKED